GEGPVDIIWFLHEQIHNNLNFLWQRIVNLMHKNMIGSIFLQKKNLYPQGLHLKIYSNPIYHQNKSINPLYLPKPFDMLGNQMLVDLKMVHGFCGDEEFET
ncbi:hypothetical protein ACJX0J_028513, partial [Zea mays]